MEKNYYEILQVPRTANNEEIKNAYKKLSLKSHVDKNIGDLDTQIVAEEMFQLVSSAFHVLRNKEAREVYDKFGESGLFGLARNNKAKIKQMNFKKSSEVDLGSSNDNVDSSTFQATPGNIYGGRTSTTLSRFPNVYTGDEDPIETFVRVVVGRNDIFELTKGLMIKR